MRWAQIGWHGTRVSQEVIINEGLKGYSVSEYFEEVFKALKQFHVSYRKAKNIKFIKQRFRYYRNAVHRRQVWVSTIKEFACRYSLLAPEAISDILYYLDIPANQIKEYLTQTYGTPKVVKIRLYPEQEISQGDTNGPAGKYIPPKDIITITTC